VQKILTLTLTSLLIITGCTQATLEDSMVVDPNDKSAEIFEQKAKCAGYEEKALAQLEENYNYDDPMFANITTFTNLEKIFYSEKADSCLYTLTHSTLINSQRCKHFTLKDVLTREELVDEYSCEEPGGVVTSINGKTYAEAYEDFSAQIIEYDPDFKGIENWSL